VFSNNPTAHQWCAAVDDLRIDMLMGDSLVCDPTTHYIVFSVVLFTSRMIHMSPSLKRWRPLMLKFSRLPIMCQLRLTCQFFCVFCSERIFRLCPSSYLAFDASTLVSTLYTKICPLTVSIREMSVDFEKLQECRIMVDDRVDLLKFRIAYTHLIWLSCIV